MRHLSRRKFLKQAGIGSLAVSVGCRAPVDVSRTASDRTPTSPVSDDPPEKKAFTDPVTGRTIWQLTDSRLESKHSYYDLCPWSHDGSHLVFTSVDSTTLSPGPEGAYGSALMSRQAVVRIMDTQAFRIRTVAREAAYNSHGASFAQWQPRHRAIYYNRSDGQVGVVDVDTGKTDAFPGGIRQMSPDGGSIVYHAPSEEASSDSQDGARVDRDAVFVAGMDGSARRQVVTKEQLYDLTPNRGEFDLEHMTIGNTKWRSDGRHILLANFVHPKPKVRRSLYVIRADGSEARWLCHFGHHHSWSPDGASILFNDWKSGSGYRMHLIDFDGTNKRLVCDAIEGSHPLMAADGKRIVDFDHKGIFMVHVAGGSVERLSLYRQPFRMDIAGTHPHVVWNHDGTQVLYNSAETGHSELYMIPDVS